MLVVQGLAAIETQRVAVVSTSHMSTNSIKGSRCVIEPETLPTLLSTR